MLLQLNNVVNGPTGAGVIGDRGSRESKFALSTLCVSHLVFGDFSLLVFYSSFQFFSWLFILCSTLVSSYLGNWIA